MSCNLNYRCKHLEFAKGLNKDVRMKPSCTRWNIPLSINDQGDIYPPVPEFKCNYKEA